MLENQSIQELITQTEESVVMASNSISMLNVLLNLVITCIMAYIGYRIVLILMNKIIKESNKLNGIIDNSLQSEIDSNSVQSQTTTINVDGTSTETEMTISGEETKSIDEEARQDFENDELFAEIQQKHEEQKIEKKSTIPNYTLIMFIAAGIYLVGNWLLALISGF